MNAETDGANMKARTIIVFIGLALIIIAPAALAGQGQSTDREAGKLFDFNTTRDRLEHAVDLWHDANLKGNRAGAEEKYESILVLLGQDIVSSRRMLRLFAQERLLQHSATDIEEKNLLESNGHEAEMEVERKEIEQLAALINTKVAIKDAIDRSKVFSNRYRLLGDYINLLRKELDIPKVKLALEMAEAEEGNSK